MVYNDKLYLIGGIGMKRKNLVFIVVLIIALLNMIFSNVILAKEVATKTRHYDFRKTRWGMNKMQVKESEKSKFIDDFGKWITYKVIVGINDCVLTYRFTEDKLIEADYTFFSIFTTIEKIAIDNACKSDMLKEDLIKKYGEPVYDSILFSLKSASKIDLKDWYFAVASGEVTRTVFWENPDTEICLLVYRTDLAIVYKSVKLKSLEEKAEKKRIMNEL